MAVFSSRSAGYKAGLLVLVLFSLVYLIGYASPFWITADTGTAKSNQGLWMLCVESSSINTCVNLGFENLKAWFHITRLFSSLGLIFLLTSCIVGMVSNCRSIATEHNRRLEVWGFIGGLMAFIGAMVFVGEFHSIHDSFSDLRELGWAFYLAAIGSAVAIAASIVVAVSNYPLSTPNTSGVVISRGAAASTAYPSSTAAQPYVVSTPGYSYPSAYSQGYAAPPPPK